MSNLNNSVYEIKDLYIVKFNDQYVEKKDEEYMRYYNKNLNFIVEKFSTEHTGELPFYIEIYTECISEQDLIKREDTKPFENIPSIFESLEKFPLEYLTKEEITSGLINSKRLFQIFQEINVKNKTLIKEQK